MVLHSNYIKVSQNVQNVLGKSRKSPRFPPLQMLISQQGKWRRSRISIIAIGIITLTMGIILSMIPWVDYFILRNLKLINGSLSFQYWQRPGVIRLTKVYIFNVTNPDSFLRYGEKPKLQEVGPFVYREDMQKINIKFHENGTVSFQHKKILEFVPDMSVNSATKLTVPNIPLLSLTSQSNTLGSMVRGSINLLLMFSNYKPFITLTPDQLVLGYDDTIITLAHQFYPKHKRPKDKMGLLLGRNGTISEISTIYTGENDMTRFGIIDNINGHDQFPYWQEEPCSKIHGSEGSFFPPRYFTKSDIVHIYDKDICRILPLKYRGSETKSGINVDLYTPTFDVYKDLPINKCFCPNTQICPPKGLQSVSPCHFDAPIYVSNPHFFEADQEIQDAFEGLNPDPEKHTTYMKIQPKIGVPLEGKVRLQVNLKVDRAKDIGAVANFPSMYFPIMWLEEGVDELSPPIRRWIYLATTFCDIASPLVTYGCIFLGSCIVIAVIVNGYKSLVFTKETIEIGMKNLRRHSNFMKNYSILEDMTDQSV